MLKNIEKKDKKNKKFKLFPLDKFDWFIIGLMIGLIVALLIWVYAFYQIITYENLPSKCYTNITPSSYFTSPLKHVYIENNSFTIESDDRIHISQTAGTGSMNPLMKKDSLLLYILHPKTISVGDILIYKNGNSSIVHRVINIIDEGFIMKGDNNDSPDDEIVKKENIVGKVVGILWNFLPINI